MRNKSVCIINAEIAEAQKSQGKTKAFNNIIPPRPCFSAIATQHPKYLMRTGWALLTLLLMTSTAQAAPGGGRSSPVNVAEAKQLLMAPQTWVAGTVISRHEARLAAEVAGKLVQEKEVGTLVKENAKIGRASCRVRV